MNVESVFGVEQPLIGMVHLPPLPGSPGFDGDRSAIHERARTDAHRLVRGGCDGIIVENFGDAPFYPDNVPRHVVAELAAVTRSVCDCVDTPVGLNVLRNDGPAAMSIAAAVDAAFIRVNVHTGARVTDQGIIEGTAYETMRLRERLETDVAVFADIDVKHSAPLTQGATGLEAVAENVERGFADGIIVSGDRTGSPTDPATVAEVQQQVRELELNPPVFVGSGVTIDTAADVFDVADGAIVGTALKEEGKTTNPVDESRVERLAAAANRT